MSKERKPLSKKTRFDVFKRDGFVCQYCGATPPKVVLEVDHITPVASGGTNAMSNLLTACFDCNRGKGAMHLSAIPESLTAQAEIVAEKLEQIRAYERLIKRKKKTEDASINEVESALQMHFPGYTFSPLFRESVRTFLQHITVDQLVGYMHTACTRTGEVTRSPKYFCGICWKQIKSSDRRAS